jgi:hypothetical protein
MRTTSRIRRGAMTIVVAALAACVDSPSAPESVADDPLATSFEDLSGEATTQGDAGRAEEFGWAALAVRAGIAPSVLEVRNAGVVEVYSAFVHGVGVSATLPSGAMNFTTQTLIAWRRTGEKLQVLMVGGPAGVTQVLHPAAAGVIVSLPVGPRAAGHAAYFERGPEPGSWVGTSGTMKLEQLSVGEACGQRQNNSTSLTVNGCQKAQYRAGFDIVFTKTRPDVRRVESNATTRRIAASEQNVNGVKLTITCRPGNSDRPCS